MQGSMNRRIGPNFLKRERNFKGKSRDQRTVDSVGIFKGESGDPQTVDLVKIFKGESRDPRMAESFQR